MKIKAFLQRLHWVLSSQFGLDPLLLFRGLVELPSYLSDWRNFARLSRRRDIKLQFKPALHDRRASSGITDEYFWQDLAVAQMIHTAQPPKHVDVGSMINGFVAHLASFMDVEVIDIRPLPQTIPRVTFKQHDLMTAVDTLRDYTPSLSCLHTIEHFGLGRYGDPLNVDGPAMGIANLAAMVQPGGLLYLSTPIGRERIEFNANWIIDPCRIRGAAANSGLRIERFLHVRDGKLVESENIDNDIQRLVSVDYALGIFVLRKAWP